MSKSMRYLTCACVLAALVSTSSAHATALKSSESIRTAQMQLAELGYFADRYDGILGSVTRAALQEFQRNNGLIVSGVLTPETANLLIRMDYGVRNSSYYGNAYLGYSNYYNIGSRAEMHSPIVDWGNRWHVANMYSIPSRFAKVDVHEDRAGSLSNFSITLNGAPVLFAKNQPNFPQISRTFNLGNEDAVIITTSNGDGICSHRNFLLTLRSNNTFVGPQEIGNCSDVFEASVHNHLLYINFKNGFNDVALNSVWRYANGSLRRL
ncbi:MAG: peptidoglycan-binding domain-containing protein [Alphaproteobacteria bacterium]|nr:peptidoglycan-binding domain-containing protein [Alphaproteobacteria bacterium]